MKIINVMLCTFFAGFLALPLNLSFAEEATGSKTLKEIGGAAKAIRIGLDGARRAVTPTKLGDADPHSIAEKERRDAEIDRIHRERAQEVVAPLPRPQENAEDYRHERIDVDMRGERLDFGGRESMRLDTDHGRTS